MNFRKWCAIWLVVVVFDTSPILGEPLLRGTVHDDGARFAGFYGGVNAGYGWGSASLSGIANNGVDMDGFAVGGQVGFRHRLDNFVFGVEGDVDATSMSYEESLGGVTTSVSSNWLSSIRGNVGFVADNLLFYATAGVAWGEMEMRASAMGVSASLSDTMTGFVYGGGIELAVTPRFTSRLEVLHYDFSEQDLDVLGTTVAYDADFTVIRTGLSYYLN